MPISLGSNSKESIKEKQNENQKTTLFNAKEPEYSFEDLILSKEIRQQFDDVIASVKYAQLVYERWGLGRVLKRPKHVYVNLYGVPGTGKTMAAHALSKALDKKMICVNYAEIESKYVGETAKNLVSMFDSAAKQDSILFFDEADALLSKRVTNMSNSTDVSVNQTRSVLLTLLDNYDGIIIFATNFISNYDSAFMRRINYHIQFPMPDKELRLYLWKHYIPKKMPTEIDFEGLTEKYDGITGNDISNAVLMAALKGARLQVKEIPQSYFEDAIESIKQSAIQNNHQTRDAIKVEERDVSEEYVREQLKQK